MNRERIGEPADDDFKAFFEERVGHILAQYAETMTETDPTWQDTETMRPALLIYGTNHQMAIVPIELNTASDKERYTNTQIAMASNTEMVACAIMLTETWVVEQMTMETQPEGSLEHVPGRKECLLISGMRGRMQLMCMAEIDRANKKLTNERIIDPTDGTHTGRLVLNKPTKH